MTQHNLLKNKASFFINTFCLAIGITSFFWIFVFVSDELSYDRYWKDYQRNWHTKGDGCQFVVNFHGVYQRFHFVGFSVHPHRNACRLDWYAPLVKRFYLQNRTYSHAFVTCFPCCYGVSLTHRYLGCCSDSQSKTS